MPEDIPRSGVDDGTLVSGQDAPADDVDLTKRKSLKTVGALAGLTALGLAVTHMQDKEVLLERAIRHVERRLRHGGDLDQILTDGTPVQVWEAFFGPNASVSGFDRDRLEGTRLDPSHPRVLSTFPSIQIGIRTGPPAYDMFEGEPGLFVTIRDNAHPEPKHGRFEGVIASANGILLPWPDDERLVVLTNAHVADGLAGVKTGMTVRKHPRGVDLAVVSIPREDCEVIGTNLGEQRMAQRVHLQAHNEDLHGRFAVVAGIDPDASAKDGIKFYGGFLVSAHRSAGLARALFRAPPPTNLEGYFIVGVPQEQLYLLGTGHPSPMGGILLNPVVPYLLGTSGSPVLLAYRDGSLVQNGGVSVAGLISGFFSASEMRGAPPGHTCCGGLLYVVPSALESFEIYP